VLNAALDAALSSLAIVAQKLGASRTEARRVVTEIFAHATRLLLLAHTGRMRKFGVSAPDLMKRFVDNTINALPRPDPRRPAIPVKMRLWCQLLP
jgi:hypothetical protein